MTTIIAFQPQPTELFAVTITLDGDQYNLITTWNVAGQRWYINIYDQQGNLVLCRPMTMSPDFSDINLIEYYFNSTLVFRNGSSSFEVSP